MQEYGWLHWNDFFDMLQVVGTRPEPRRLRLAACAFVRRVWHLLEDGHLRAAVELAEDFADHTASWQDLKRARQAITTLVQEAQAQFIRDNTNSSDWIDGEEPYRWQMRAGQLPIARTAAAVVPLLLSKTINTQV